LLRNNPESVVLKEVLVTACGMPEIDSNDLNNTISVYRILWDLLHMCRRHDYNYKYKC
jgi:hypothetical protein